MPTPYDNITDFTCPICGGELADQTGAVAADVAPLMCEPCCRSWWLCEMTPTSRAAFDPLTRSFWGGEVQELIQVGAYNESVQAQVLIEANANNAAEEG